MCAVNLFVTPHGVFAVETQHKENKMSEGMKMVNIQPILNGWLVQVGCQSVAFTDKQTMLNELGDYLDNPRLVEKRFLERAKNKLSIETGPGAEDRGRVTGQTIEPTHAPAGYRSPVAPEGSGRHG
jgi:hypothetical protein